MTETHFFWDGIITLKSLTNLYRDFYLAPVFKAAKLTGDPHPHQFRHTFATKLLSHGTSVENVAALLGNSPRIVWRHYAAWVKERQEALDQAVLNANGFHEGTPPEGEATETRAQPGQTSYKSGTKVCCVQKYQKSPVKPLEIMAEGVGFEPTRPFQA